MAYGSSDKKKIKTKRISSSSITNSNKTERLVEHFAFVKSHKNRIRKIEEHSMTQLNRKDFFRLDNTDGKSYLGFVRSGLDLVTLILLDPETNTLKTVTGISANGNNVIKLSKSDMPAILKKAYDECFITVKKGSTVTFNFNGEDYTGVVVKGGANPKVEVTIDNKLCYTSGPAVLFKVVEE